MLRLSLSLAGAVKKVIVNGKDAKATAANFSAWEITLDAATAELKALAEDDNGNVEKTPHEVKLK